jgi:hypothetical protein
MSVASGVLEALCLAACVQAMEFDLNSLPHGACCSHGAAIVAGATNAPCQEDPTARAALTGDGETLRRGRASGRAEPAQDLCRSLLHRAALCGRAEAMAFRLGAGVPARRRRSGSAPAPIRTRATGRATRRSLRRPRHALSR